MKLKKESHTSRPWRVHALTGDFRLEDVWALSTPGGPDDLARLVELVASQDEHEFDHPAIFRFLFALRWKLGEVFGWDGAETGVGERVGSLRERLPADLLEGPRGPDLRTVPGRSAEDGPPILTSVYLTHDEWVAELANETVHSLMHIGWVRDSGGTGYHAQMAVLTKPNGWLGEAYMAAIKPIRHLAVYPMLLRTIERRWQGETRTGGRRAERGRRVAVADPVAIAERYDYADAFELELHGPDPHSPQEWFRAGMDAVPSWIKRAAGSPDGFGSARVVESRENVLVLEDSDPLMETLLIARNLDGERRLFTTVLRYRRPALARAVWAFVGILHRRTARRLVAAGLRQGELAATPSIAT